jgi:hypothetical protein
LEIIANQNRYSIRNDCLCAIRKYHRPYASQTPDPPPAWFKTWAEKYEQRVRKPKNPAERGIFYQPFFAAGFLAAGFLAAGFFAPFFIMSHMSLSFLDKQILSKQGAEKHRTECKKSNIVISGLSGY